VKTALAFHSVVKTYGSTRALDGLSFAIPAGAICGLVGSNGAGKTTTLALAAGLLSPGAGRIEVLGNGPWDPSRKPGQLALLPQDSILPPEATVGQLLRLYARLQDVPPNRVERDVEEALSRVHLLDRKEAPTRTLSHGMRRRVMIAQAFLGNPALILLDEPLNGLDPREAAAARDLFASWRGRATLVISSHVLSELERLCDFIVILEKGKALHAGSLTQWLRQEQRLIYELEGASLDWEILRREYPHWALSLSPDGRLLECRYDPAQWDAVEVNGRLLPRLLEAGVGIRAIRPGETLESRYLDTLAQGAQAHDRPETGT
jgi:ABC-2 type transport system ATP-binding protein